MLPFLYLLNMVLMTRIWLYFNDARARGWKLLVACAVQEAATLALSPDEAVRRLQIAILLFNLLAWLFEFVGKSAAGKRLLILGLYVLAFSFFFAPNNGVHLNPLLKQYVTQYHDWSLLARLEGIIDWKKFNFYLFGTLLCLNEANLLVRYAIEKLAIRPTRAPAASPPTPNEKTDEKEYNRGRIIGYLERLMFFFFVVHAQYTVLGFVISAKTIARFKDLDDRNFAEYFIVGTMLSVTVAGAIGMLINFVCPI